MKKTIFLYFVLWIFIFYFLYWLICFLTLPLAEKWIGESYIIKHHIIRDIKNQKIIFVGGSSSLFGLNGKIIEKNLKSQYQIINLATHAGLPINFHIDEAIRFATKGDIVIMPLEFDYYTRNQPNYKDNWYIQNMLSWGEGYRKFITPKDIFLNFFFMESKHIPKSIVRFVVHKIRYSKQDIIQEWQNHTPSNLTYTYKNLNTNGDFCIPRKSFFSDKTTFSYLPNDIKLSSFFVNEIQRAKETLASKGVKLFLAFPPTMKNKDFNLDSNKIQEQINQLKEELAHYDITIIGDVKDFHYPPQLFYDTNYHLNCNGSKKRSQKMAEIINSEILESKPPRRFDPQK